MRAIGSASGVGAKVDSGALGYVAVEGLFTKCEKQLLHVGQMNG